MITSHVLLFPRQGASATHRALSVSAPIPWVAKKCVKPWWKTDTSPQKKRLFSIGAQPSNHVQMQLCNFKQPQPGLWLVCLPQQGLLNVGFLTCKIQHIHTYSNNIIYFCWNAEIRWSCASRQSRTQVPSMILALANSQLKSTVWCYVKHARMPLVFTAWTVWSRHAWTKEKGDHATLKPARLSSGYP